jgi:hypothetical protein
MLDKLKEKAVQLGRSPNTEEVHQQAILDNMVYDEITRMVARERLLRARCQNGTRYINGGRVFSIYRRLFGKRPPTRHAGMHEARQRRRNKAAKVAKQARKVSR